MKREEIEDREVSIKLFQKQYQSTMCLNLVFLHTNGPFPMTMKYTTAEILL